MRALVCLAAFTAVLVWGAAPAAAEEKAPRIAVISLADVFTGYKKTKEIESDLEAKFKPMDAELNTLRVKVDKLIQALDFYPPGSEAYENQVNEIDRCKLDLKQKRQAFMAKSEKAKVDGLRDIYKEIRAVVDEYAKGRGFTLVLRRNKEQVDEAKTTRDFNEIVQMTVVIYQSAETDITQAVVDLLNSRYKGPAKAPATEPEPPARNTQPK